MKLSVIMPAYNAAGTLSEAVESVETALPEDAELIIIDDGSTDDTAVICASLSKKYSNIRLLSQPNSGVSAARNAGLDAAKGEYLAFCDSDDTVSPEIYSKLLEAVQSGDAEMAVCGRRLLKGEGQDKAPRVQAGTITGDEGLRLLFIDDGFDISMCNKLFSKRLFEENRFDPSVRITEELLVMLKAVEGAKSIAVMRDILYFVRINPSSATRSGFGEKFLDAVKVSEKALESCTLRHPEAADAALAYNTAVLVETTRRAIRAGERATAAGLRKRLMADYGKRISNSELGSNPKKKLRILKFGLPAFSLAMKLYYR